MKALLFEGIPETGSLSGASGAFASGTNVYREEVIRALWKYGTYDAYFFLQRTPFHSDQRTTDLKSLDARTQVIGPSRVEQLNTYDDVVLFTPVPYINSLLPLRSSPQAAQWIANGVVHSLDGWNLPFLPLSLIHSDVDEADSILCSTRAGKEVLEKLFGLLSAGEWSISCSSEPRRPSLPVIPLGIDCQVYKQFDRHKVRSDLGLAADATVVLYLGRISPISKCDLLPLFHVFARIFQIHAEIQLFVAGDDTQHEMTEFLESAAQVLGCSSCIRIFPNINKNDKTKLLTAADIFISPSDNTQETFGLTVIEALAAGVPVIASDWNGYRELIANGETGFLIPTYWLPLDEGLDRLASTSFSLRNAMLAASTIVDLSALEHHLQLLVEQSDLRKTMGQLGRRHALEKYDWSVVIKAYEDVWNDGFMKARVLRKGKSHFANCPPHYPYQEIFSHYPSHQLNDTEVVEITPAGGNFLDADDSAELTISPNGAIDLSSVRQLLRIAGRLGPSSITDLAEQAMHETGISRLTASTSIAFSLKYGFLRLRNPIYSPPALV
jgi:D-inositol-3-phosphate glycosyltransferase